MLDLRRAPTVANFPNRRNPKGRPMEHDPISLASLSARLAKTRGGVFEPTKMVAAELQNITDLLLELLKEIRRINP
jgi:hypothetical protein